MSISKGYRFPHKWVTAPCATCQKAMTFRVSKPQRFCSRLCAGRGIEHRPADPAKKVETPCATCGVTFERYASEERRFCSRTCSGKANVTNTGRPTGTRYTAVCEQCGVRYETTPAVNRGRFCSRTCWGHWLSVHNVGMQHPRTGKKTGRPAPNAVEYVPITCGVCGAVFPVKPSHAARRRFCSRACQGAWQSANNVGENSPTWLGGHEPYYGPSWRPAMRAVRQRDKVCQRCGMTPKQNGRALDVHHVTAFRAFGLPRHAEANDPANLVALCHDCHLLVEWETNRRDGARVEIDAPSSARNLRPAVPDLSRHG